MGLPGTLVILFDALVYALVTGFDRIGFKILLDIVASARHPVAFQEVPFVFRARTAGASKLDTLVAWEYGMLLADKLFVVNPAYFLRRYAHLHRVPGDLVPQSGFDGGILGVDSVNE